MVLSILKYFLPFLFTCFTFYLVAEEFYGYLQKPTHTSISEDFLSKRHFPVLFVCPNYAYRLETLRKHGYESAFHYFRGGLSSSKLLRWNGNFTNVTTEEFENEITTFSAVTDCPGFENNARYYSFALLNENRYLLEYKLTKSIYPFGRCCQAKIPTSSQGFLANIAIVDNDTSYGGFRIFLTDQNSATDFEMDQLRTSGPVIEAVVGKIVLYRSKILEYNNLEDDVQFECRHYDKHFSYHQISNCAPPFITANKSLWCQGSIEANLNVNFFLLDLFKGRLDKGDCHQPCRTQEFRVSRLSSSNWGNRTGVNIAFEKSVKVTQSHFSINTLTLLTRIGGAIGVGKEGLWLILLFVNQFMFLFVKIKKRS